MAQRVGRDKISGLLAIAIGGFVSVYGLLIYDLGSVRRMGPGMVPVAAGAILAGLGSLLLAQAFWSSRRRGAAPAPNHAEAGLEFRPLLTVTAAILAFALTLSIMGAVPAVIALVIIASRADSTLTLPAAAGLGAIFAGLVYLIFGLGLGLPMSFLHWSP